jgi:hypothetical protein
MRKNCGPPAAPSWFKPETEPHHQSFGEVLAGIWAGIVAWFRSWWPFH